MFIIHTTSQNVILLPQGKNCFISTDNVVKDTFMTLHVMEHVVMQFL